MSDATRRLAAIDIGTVTTRLLVADVGPSTISELARSTDITHLGQGLGSTGALSDDAMARVSQVIAGYADTMRELGVADAHAVATSASRDATNSALFLSLLADHGIHPEVISGSREAQLTFLGATSHIGSGRVLVDDIGGGSTELVLGSATGPILHRTNDIEQTRSIDVGSRRITELYLHSDPPTQAEMAAARAFVAEEMRPYFDTGRKRPDALISVAGTATTVVAVLESMTTYDPKRVHGTVVSGAQVADVLEMLAEVPLEKRRQIAGVHPQRAGVIVAGVLILETLMALSGMDSTIVSEHDILYGILLDAYAGGRS
ncbi:MAG: Ppx/GppA family phosphatase [Actinobacteria bacterium]|nr:Ppx/GppA family phosphatase [Actinomycetota bacterium]MCG2807649.1 Ppx/GppA family phosphatase [Coriobacteriia bacterium]